MKEKGKTYHTIIALLIMLSFNSCDDNKDKISMKVEGPFFKEEIFKEFDIDTVPFNIHSKDLYIVNLHNNSDKEIKVKSTTQNQIFPDSCWYHSFFPYSSNSRSWNPIEQSKPKKETLDILIPANNEKKFWFSNYYDDYIDSMMIYFTVESLNNAKSLIVYETYEAKKKVKINYGLEETVQSKELSSQTNIELKFNGPFTYSKVNEILDVKIPYRFDSEEVFIVDIKNNRNENLYVEVWEEKEINIDTIYSYSPFTLTSKEYLWNQNTNKKGAKPIDTISIQPNESQKFWDSYDRVWPTTDSIVFIKTIETDKFLIEAVKMYQVNKN